MCYRVVGKSVGKMWVEKPASNGDGQALNHTYLPVYPRRLPCIHRQGHKQGQSGCIRAACLHTAYRRGRVDGQQRF